MQAPAKRNTALACNPHAVDYTLPAFLQGWEEHRIFALFNRGTGHEKGPAISPHTGKTYYLASNQDSLLTWAEVLEHWKSGQIPMYCPKEYYRLGGNVYVVDLDEDKDTYQEEIGSVFLSAGTEISRSPSGCGRHVRMTNTTGLPAPRGGGIDYPKTFCSMTGRVEANPGVYLDWASICPPDWRKDLLAGQQRAADYRPQALMNSDGTLNVFAVANGTLNMEAELAAFGAVPMGRRWLSPTSESGMPGIILFEGAKGTMIYSHHGSDVEWMGELANGVADVAHVYLARLRRRAKSEKHAIRIMAKMLKVRDKKTNEMISVYDYNRRVKLSKLELSQ